MVGLTMSQPEFDCQKCGACCSYKWSWPVLKRDRSDARDIPDWMQRKDYPLMKTDRGGRCVALRGIVGSMVSCAVYGSRPKACVEFKPGSALCLEARAAKGIK